MGLSAEVLKAIDKLGFEQASPIQAGAIPPLLLGRDLVGQSQTGSGKTAAFAVPAIEAVNLQLRAVQILILCPTRELAIQVSEEVHKLALFKRGLHALPIYGGQSYDRQLAGLRQGAQIVIGTPGRVMDHMRRGTLRLDQVKMIILDEADVMLDMGFREDIDFVLEALPKERQTVFFSATLPRPIQDLIQRFAKNPESIRIQQTAMTVPTVEQVFYEVDRRFKIELLTRLIDIHDLKLGIIFCNTKQMVDDLTEQLNNQGYSADRLHGGMTQAMRDRVMGRFRRSGLEFLVATDVAARGIDVDDVQAVFNYDLPYDGEDYVHRIGRTGRAGRSGMAITFVSGREIFQLQQIERFTRIRIQRGRIPTVDQVEEARTNATLAKLRFVLQKGEYKRQDHLIERLLEEGFTSTDIASALLHELQGGSDNPARPAVPAKPPGPSPVRPGRGTIEREAASRPAPAEPPPAPRPPMERPPTPQAPLAPSFADRPRIPRAKDPLKAAQHPPAPREAHEAGPPREFDVEVKASSKIPAPAPGKRPVRPNRPPLGVNEPGPAPVLTKLFINAGEAMGVVPDDIIAAILGTTGLPAATVSKVDLRERHTFVEVAAEHAQRIISQLNRSKLHEHTLKVKLA
jgi:ATP-dependent RNA helicase DeaD